MGKAHSTGCFLVLVLLAAASPVPASPDGQGGSRNDAAGAPLRAHYTIDCRIDSSATLLSGSSTIRFVNTTPNVMLDIALDWYPAGGGIKAINAGEHSLPVPDEAARASAGSLTRIGLPEPLEPGDSMEMKIEFERKLQKRGNQIKISGWHPRILWDSAEGSRGRHGHDDFAVKVAIPRGHALATSGRLDRESGFYCADNVRNFGLFLGREHLAAEAEAGDVVVRCLFTPKGANCARLLLDTAVDVIDFYRKRFGFYPYPSLSIVPGAARPMGGYPMATSIVVIHGQEKKAEASELHWKWITAHEIGHQYFGEYVLENDFPGWLWIGLGIFADREYALARGWGMRKHRKFIDTYLNGFREGYDTTVAVSSDAYSKIEFDFNNVVIHGKGYAIISALNCVLGRKIFNRIVETCLKDHAGRRLGAVEFQKLCEKESGQELDWFFDQWVRSNKFLSYAITSQECRKEDARYVTEITVACRGTLKMPVPVKAVFSGGSEEIRFTDRHCDPCVVTFTSDAPLEKAKLDPRQELALVTEPRSLAAEKEVMRSVHNLPWTGAGERAVKVFQEACKANIRQSGIWFVLGIKLYDGRNNTEALQAFETAANLAGNKTTDKFSSLVWQGHILDLSENRRSDAVRCYKEALKQFNGTPVRHDQYGIVLNRQWIEARIGEPFRRQ